jgi:hypothetical protein
VQDAIQQGLAALRTPDLNIQTLATYTAVGTPSYNPTTGTITSPNTAFPNVPVVFTSFKRIEIDGEAVRAEDQKAIIATRDLTPVPTVNDTITRADGTVWSVIGINADPAGAAWVLHVRWP